MRSAGGYSIIIDPSAPTKEHDTFTCAHCQAITFTKAGHGPLQVAIIQLDGSVRMQAAGFCQSCFRHICPRCEGKGCNPVEKQIELEEKAARLILP